MRCEGTIDSYRIELTSDDVNLLETAGDAAVAALVAAGATASVATAIRIMVDLIVTMNEIGGHNGVIISGHGTTFVVVPAGVAVIDTVLKIIDNIAAGLSGVCVNLLQDAIRAAGHAFGFGADRGELHANEKNVGPFEERFTLICLGTGQVALLSFTGYVSCRHDIGGRVAAIAGSLDIWERWGLVRNDDGTVSFTNDQSTPEHPWFMTVRGDSRDIWTDASAVRGVGEKFVIESLDGGQIALRWAADVDDHYVSSAP